MTNPLVVAYGGGVNSTAMLVEMRDRGVLPDLILFADTGSEMPETYETLNAVNNWCEQNGMTKIQTVRKTFQGKPESLEANCLRQKMLPSIAYGFKSCSLKYKADPQNKFCNNWAPAQKAWESGLLVTKAIGYDADESRRAKIPSDSKYLYWYPLIDWGLYREDCLRLCKREGLPTHKSSCFFCPSMKKKEILDLNRKHPDLLKRAVAMEQNAELTTVKGLGRNYAWADLINNDFAQCRLFPDEDTDIPCGCYDG